MNRKNRINMNCKKDNMNCKKEKQYKTNLYRASLAAAFLSMGFSFRAPAAQAELVLTRVDAVESSTSEGYLFLEPKGLDTLLEWEGPLLPGDWVSGVLKVSNTDSGPASLYMQAANRGDEDLWKKLVIAVYEKTGESSGAETEETTDTSVKNTDASEKNTESSTYREVFRGTPEELEETRICSLEGETGRELKIEVGLPLNLKNEMMGSKVSLRLRFKALLQDYRIVTEKPEGQNGGIDRYISLYDGRCYYTESGECALEKREYSKGQRPDCSPDLEVYAGNDRTFGTEDDYYVDPETGYKMYPGKDNVFGSEDDSKYAPGSGTGTAAGAAAGTKVAAGYGTNNGINNGTNTAVFHDSPSESTSTMPAVVVWTLEDEEKQSWSCTVNGVTPKNQWVYAYWSGTDRSDWYYFNQDGIMQTDWQQSAAGNWYHLHNVSDGRLGALDTGFYYENQDKSWYYLDEANGSMQKGWKLIKGEMYYFSEEGAEQNWFWKSALGKWVYGMTGRKSMGAMYSDEYTPDGRYINPKGVYEQKQEGEV